MVHLSLGPSACFPLSRHSPVSRTCLRSLCSRNNYGKQLLVQINVSGLHKARRARMPACPGLPVGGPSAEVSLSPWLFSER